MGFNTVVLVLNDYMHEIIKSPHAVTWAICHPPHGTEDLEKWWWPQVEAVARDYGESAKSLRSALKVLPTYHADDKHVLIAGWNSLIRPEYEDYKYNNKKNEMTIKMPDYWKK